MRTAAVIVLAFGCGRIGFQAVPAVAGSDAPTDVSVDAPAASECAARTPLTLDRLSPVGTLADFPLPVVLDDTRADRALLAADTLRFLDATGHVLASEIEQPGSAGGPPLVAWVRVPSITAAPLSLVACYGGSAPPAASLDSVWTNGFVAVWHLAGATAGDSTGNGHDGNLLGTTTSAGVVGDARALLPANMDAIAVPDSPELSPAELTISGWMYEQTTPPSGFTAVLTRQSTTNQNDLYLGVDNGLGYSVLRMPGGYITPFGGSVAVQQWNHYALTYDGTTARFYLNGAQTGTTATTGNVVDTAGLPLYFGADRDSAGSGPNADFLDGMLDEIRFERVARSAAWIEYEVAAMRDQVISYGPVEHPGP